MEKVIRSGEEVMRFTKPDMILTEEEKTLLKGATAADYIRMIRTHTRINEIVIDRKNHHIKLKDIFLYDGNPTGLSYSQGIIDFCHDLLDVLDGKHIPTTKEIFESIEEVIKKEKEQLKTPSEDNYVGPETQ